MGCNLEPSDEYLAMLNHALSLEAYNSPDPPSLQMIKEGIERELARLGPEALNQEIFCRVEEDSEACSDSSSDSGDEA